MRNNTNNRWWMAGLIALALVGAAEAGERSATARRSAPKKIAYRTTLPALPKELKVEPHRDRDREVRAERLGDLAELTRGARLAAHWAAEELVSTAGRGESFRAGFFDGQREAWSDPWLGVADLEAGRSDGLRDPDARRAGRDAGRIAAERQALDIAAFEVEAQFRDLSREPRLTAPIPRVQFNGELPLFEPLSLRELIEAQSFTQLRLEPQWARHLRAWNVSPWQLHNCTDRAEFFVADWASPARGLALVAVDSRQSRFFTRLTPVQREAFVFHFERELAHRIAVQFESALEEAYQAGFQNGWSWGAWLREEAAYEEGYSAGALQGADRAAQRSFERAWESTFVAAYEAEFARWSHQAVLELGAIDVVDLDRDGVLAPGDDVELWVDWINYGGAGTRAQLTVDGQELVRPVHAAVDVNPRQRSRQPVRLVAQIQERAANGKLDVWRVELDGESVTLESLIQAPVQISQPRVSLRDVELGALAVVVDVQNISTRDRSAGLRLRAAPWTAEERELGVIAAGETRSVEWVLNGIDGLEIIAGRVRLEAQLDGERVSHAVHQTLRVAGSARDLGSDELHRWIARFGADRALDASSAERARELLLERLQADWRRAVKGSGNPYKKDLKSGSTRTEVGEWVRLQRTQRSAGGVNVVLAGLHRDLDQVADDLPGVHPFLRKALRRLAARLA